METIKKQKTFSYKVTLSSKVDAFGKSEIRVRFDISRTNRPQFKSGIFINPSFFFDGEIYSEDAAHKAEAEEADGRLKSFISTLRNIVVSTQDAIRRGNQAAISRLNENGEIGKEWIERVLMLSNTNKSINLMEASFRDMNDAVKEEEETAKRKAEAEAARQRAEEARLAAEEERKSRKTFYQYIDEYCKTEGISEHRTRMYQVFARLLMRFQLYMQKVKGYADYSIDYDTLTTQDIEAFRDYARNESKWSKKHRKEFREIESKVAELLPIKYKIISRDVNERGENYVFELIKKFKSVMAWMRRRGITTNDPFEAQRGHWGKEIYGRPIYITAEERNKIADFDLSGNPSLEVQRDIFIFQCLTGCRVGDLMRLEPSNIVGGVLEYIPSKTKKDSDFVQPRVPLHQRALTILNKYDGVDKQGRILPFIAEQNYNEAIKKIFEICGITRNVIVRNPTTGKEESRPINEVASSHMARRTFVGALVKKTQDPNLVGTLSGHREGSKAIARYYKYEDEDRKNLIDLL